MASDLASRASGVVAHPASSTSKATAVGTAIKGALAPINTPQYDDRIRPNDVGGLRFTTPARPFIKRPSPLEGSKAYHSATCHDATDGFVAPLLANDEESVNRLLGRCRLRFTRCPSTGEPRK